ncbi:MAG: CHAP domain-containing protein [Candidatus Saccharibacteria bacterium]|nr:CHAP domain-containing protein [Candidatus Saccharibacteria bacterium]
MKNLSTKTKLLIGVVGAAIIAICVTIIMGITLSKGGKATINYSDENRSATITIGEDDTNNKDSEVHGMGEVGEEVEIEVPTVEEVIHDGPVMDTDAGEGVSAIPDDGEEHGLGAFIYAPTGTWSEFKNAALGQCWNSDNFAGSQCWDQFDVFVQNAVGRRAQTCGTGAAKGMIQDGCWQKNAGSEFIMIWDAKDLQPGDWVVFTSGTWGHVGMAVGKYNNGYITLLGQNQGGKECPGGGSAGNIINISLKSFGGAFRYKPYEEARLKAEAEAKRKAEEARKKAEEEAAKKYPKAPNTGIYIMYSRTSNAILW